MLDEFSIETNQKVEFVDITSELQKIIKKNRVNNGQLQIHIPHTTAAVTINENADPSVKKDIIKEINKIIPFDDNYSHMEGNSAAHIKSSFFGVDQLLIIKNSKIDLGTWQSVYFCEFDGPRKRKVKLQIIET
jgi:secondary thiamine-phosphate synthase enzyme